LTNEIVLIIECCKLSPAFEQIENRISEIKNWDDFMSLSYSHGVFPLVYKVLKKYENKIPLDVFIFMKQTYMDLVKTNMLMTSELIKVSNLLEENGIRSIAFKGPILSAMAYGDIISRQYVDLDILVDENKLLDAIKFLENNEYKLEDDFKLDLLKKNRSIFHDVTLRKNNIINIELHWRLFSDEYMTGISDLNIKENLKCFEYQNQKLNVFDNEIQILYLAIHGAKHNWERIEWLVDIVRFIENNVIDWQQLFYLIEKTKTEKILFSTFYLCKNILDFSFPIKIEKKIQKANNLRFSKRFEMFFYENFDSALYQEKEAKKISKIQFDILHGYKNKLLFIIALIKPTELDYQSVKLPKYLNFLYYLIRPFNLITRKTKVS
jgi:hypothetical protein